MNGKWGNQHSGYKINKKLITDTMAMKEFAVRVVCKYVKIPIGLIFYEFYFIRA